MNIDRHLRFFFIILVGSQSACTAPTTSTLKYANSATTLEAIKEKTCNSYLKEGDCLLRLQGYEADSNLTEALNASLPMYLKTLIMYKLDVSKLDNPYIAAANKALDTNKLNRPELAALMNYAGPMYHNMNAALRGSLEDWNRYKNLIYGAASALTHLTGLAVKAKVYRSERVEGNKRSSIEEIYKPGNIVFEASFLSTSTNEKLLFCNQYIQKSDFFLRYTISSKSGIAIRQFSAQPEEDEVLFAPGTIFRVQSFSRGRNEFDIEVFYIGLEEIE